MLDPTSEATITELFEQSAALHGKHEAVTETTYSALKTLCDRLVGGLQSLDVKPGEIVCLLFSVKSIDVVAVMLAVMRLGAAIMPLEVDYPLQRLVYQCRSCGNSPRLLIHGRDKRDAQKAESLHQELDLSIHEVSDLYSSCLSLTDISKWNDLCLVLSTSGSTGEPKIVPYTHRNLALSVTSICTALSIDDTTRICNVITYIWDGGILDLLGPLTAGGCVCFCKEISGRGIAQTIREQNCTLIILCPSLIMEVPISILSKLRTLVTAGEKVIPRLFQHWVKSCPATAVINAYGLTETGIINTMHLGSPLQDYAESVAIGTPLPHNELVIEQETGQLVVIGRQVSDGYLNNSGSKAFLSAPNAYSELYPAMLTGDLAWVDERGEYHIRDRVDKQLDLAGFRIDPVETERTVLLSENFDLAYLFSHAWGHSDQDVYAPALVLAYHVAKTTCPSGNSTSMTQEEYSVHEQTHEVYLRRRLSSALPSHQLPTTYLPLSKIPRLVTGKVDYKAIRSLAASVQEQGLVVFHRFVDK